jgi:integrase/recombinase XerD
MTTLAPTLQSFFTDRLIRQRQASPHTIAAYRDTFKLLLAYACQRTGTEPSRLALTDLDAPLISGFLDHLEHQRGNSVRTRNARLAAVHSLFHYAALRHPDQAAVIQRVLSIPPKKSDKALVTWLTDTEVSALLAAPDPGTWTGRRDLTMLTVAIQTGLRASELTSLSIADVHLGTGAHVSCLGKGRKQRVTPLTRDTVKLLRAWLTERGGGPADPLFPTRRGGRLSCDALQQRVAQHASRAAQACPTLGTRKITPHVMRHTAAMRLLRAGVDSTVLALWLGHENVATTSVYIHADLELKERALARTTPIHAAPGRYKPADKIMEFLSNL